MTGLLQGLHFSMIRPLFAQANDAVAATSRTYYEVMRLRQLDEWWHWLLLLLVCLVVLASVSIMYFMDSRQLARGKRWLLLLLRVLAFVGLLVFFLDLQKRTEQKLVKNSRFAFLVDTSQSMGIADQDAPGGDSKESRIAQVARALSTSPILSTLRKKHDVSVYRFDETNLPVEVATFSQTEVQASESVTAPTVEESLAEVRSFWKIAMGLFVVSCLAFLCHFLLGNFVRTAEGESWALLVSVFALIVAVVLVAVSNLRQPEYGPLVAFGFRELPTNAVGDAASNPAGTSEETDSVATELGPADIDWSKLLEPAGGSTRVGDAIGWLVARERGNPLAGIGLITDGNSNRGTEPLVAAQIASESAIPIYSIGIGSELPPTNVRIVDLEAPARVYPGDEFKLSGFIQSYGMNGNVVEVQLFSRPDTQDESSMVEETLEAVEEITLGVDGSVIPIPMQVTPEGARQANLYLESRHCEWPLGGPRYVGQ